MASSPEVISTLPFSLATPRAGSQTYVASMSPRFQAAMIAGGARLRTVTFDGSMFQCFSAASRL
ncbi:hypothetical protein D3C76_1380500 [compost metagenome]